MNKTPVNHTYTDPETGETINDKYYTGEQIFSNFPNSTEAFEV